MSYDLQFGFEARRSRDMCNCVYDDTKKDSCILWYYV